MKTYPNRAMPPPLRLSGAASQVKSLCSMCCGFTTWPIIRYVPRSRLLSRSATPRPK